MKENVRARVYHKCRRVYGKDDAGTDIARAISIDLLAERAKHDGM